MNKKEFLDKLNQKLAELSQEERESAMKYYEDYFEDAGEEKEQEVISQLGSPEEIAKGILKENGKEEIEQEETNQEPINQERKINYAGLIIFILICIFFFPVIFPIFMTILGIAFGFMIAGNCNFNCCGCSFNNRNWSYVYSTIYRACNNWY